jgi:hypothetical protein
VEYIG